MVEYHLKTHLWATSATTHNTQKSDNGSTSALEEEKAQSSGQVRIVNKKINIFV